MKRFCVHTDFFTKSLRNMVQRHNFFIYASLTLQEVFCLYNLSFRSFLLPRCQNWWRNENKTQCTHTRVLPFLPVLPYINPTWHLKNIINHIKVIKIICNKLLPNINCKISIKHNGLMLISSL